MPVTGRMQSALPSLCVGTGALIVDFVGQVRTLAPGESLSFGRAADLVVDDANRNLHRVVGRLV